MSALPAEYAFSAVAESLIAVKVTLLILTFLASRHFVFLTRTIDASCFQDWSL